MDGEPIARPHFLPRDIVAGCDAVLRAGSQPEPDLRQITQLVQDLPNLNRRIVQAANATSLGLTGTIVTTDRAVAMLGSNRVREIVESVRTETVRRIDPGH